MEYTKIVEVINSATILSGFVRFDPHSRLSLIPQLVQLIAFDKAWARHCLHIGAQKVTNTVLGVPCNEYGLAVCPRNLFALQTPLYQSTGINLAAALVRIPKPYISKARRFKPKPSTLWLMI